MGIDVFVGILLVDMGHQMVAPVSVTATQAPRVVAVERMISIKCVSILEYSCSVQCTAHSSCASPCASLCVWHNGIQCIKCIIYGYGVLSVSRLVYCTGSQRTQCTFFITVVFSLLYSDS